MCPAHQFSKASSSAVYRRVPDSCQDNTLKGVGLKPLPQGKLRHLYTGGSSYCGRGFSPESRPQAGQNQRYCSCLTAEAMHQISMVALLRALR